MKKLLVIVVSFWGQNGIAAENLDDKAIVMDFKALLELNAIPRDIYGLLEQHDITGAYTKAAELKTREDDVALSNKCFLAVLLRTFPDEEAQQYALISGIDKDGSNKQAIIETSFEYLLALHHRWICSGNFQLAMRAKEACKFLLDKYPEYTYTDCVVPLSFSAIEENIKSSDNMGRELFNVSDRGMNNFFYPNDEEKAWIIYCEEDDRWTCVDD